MRNFCLLFLLSAAVPLACSPLERPDADEWNRRSSITLPDQPDSGPDRPDTLLYFSAVRFPETYDWQQDSAYGSATFELLLYCDYAPVLTLPSGPEVCFVPDPDRHHILGGHLYTERMSGTQTLVGCDGEELFRFDGREYLVGLLPVGEDLYTLSRKSTGSGFTFRRNGALLLESDDGTPFGDLSDPSYAPTGALYADDGRVVFAYRSGSAAARKYALVFDGVETPLEPRGTSQTLLDVKILRGNAVSLPASCFGQRWTEGRLWLQAEGHPAITGCYLRGREGPCYGWMDTEYDLEPSPLCQEEATIYYSSEGAYALVGNDDGTLLRYGPGGAVRTDTPERFFHPACAALSGRRFILALNPHDTALPPRILDGAREREIDLYGYISAVAVEISPPAS